LWTSRARVNNTYEHRVSCGGFPFSDTEGAIRTHCRIALMITRYRGQLLGSAVMKLTRYTAVLTDSYRRDGTDRHARPQPRRVLGNQGIVRMKRGIHRAIITAWVSQEEVPQNLLSKNHGYINLSGHPLCLNIYPTRLMQAALTRAISSYSAA
jgi:hypothetical protein